MYHSYSAKAERHFTLIEASQVLTGPLTDICAATDVSGIALSAQGKENRPPRPDTKQHHAGGEGQSHHQ